MPAGVPKQPTHIVLRAHLRLFTPETRKRVQRSIHIQPQESLAKFLIIQKLHISVAITTPAYLRAIKPGIKRETTILCHTLTAQNVVY